MINVILLAAGLSRRFGENKLLYKIKGKPLYRHVLDQALAFQARCGQKEIPVRLILVTAYEEIADYSCLTAGFYLNSLGDKERILVRNDEPEAGISHSITLGLNQAALVEKEDCVMFTVCDQPWLTAEDMVLLLEKFTRSGKGIGGLAFQGIMGNPVMFRKEYLKELLRLTGDEGGKTVVRRHQSDAFLCEVLSPKALQDIDRKEEGVSI